MKQTVYVLMACVDYEGAFPVIAFTEPELAGEWLETATDWLSNKPSWIGDSDEEFEEYEKAESQWKLQQPKLADKAWLADGFRIEEIEVVASVG